MFFSMWLCHHVTVSDLKAIPLLIINVAKGLPHSAELSSALPCPCYSWCQHWAWLGPLIRIVSGQYILLQLSPVLQGSFFEERQAPGKWPWIQCPSRGENKSIARHSLVGIRGESFSIEGTPLMLRVWATPTQSSSYSVSVGQNDPGIWRWAEGQRHSVTIP